MTDAGWSLDPASELNILVRWELTQDDRILRDRVRAFVAKLVLDPLARGFEERPNIFVAKVPSTDITLVWTLDHEQQVVSLALIGRG